ENVVSYVSIARCQALTIDGVSFHIPMATFERSLVASTLHGAPAVSPPCRTSHFRP
ncbi:hypothetical protein K438DRAFT_1611357, partial [Mycena galopus ATCC 62051]